MSYDLTNQNISDTFQNLLQKTGSGNQLYDLKGNQIIDLTIAGALHAQSYIVSQSVSNLVVTSGSTVFGDDAGDVHHFNGKISASGNVHRLSNNALGHFPRLEFKNNSNNAFGAPCIEFDSGSISGEGMLQMVGVLRDTLPFVGSGGGPKLVFRSGSIQTNGDKDAVVLDFIEPTTKLTLDGNISASGTSTFNEIEIGTSTGDEKITGVTGKVGIEAGGEEIVFFENKGLNVTNHITASGNISSSGTITMLTASIGGGIFTSASLAAGGGGTGTITALNNQTANRLVTIGSTTTELDGEANLTYDGTTFTVNDDMQVSSGKLTVGGEVSSSHGIFAQGTDLDFSVTSSATTELIVDGVVSASGDLHIGGTPYVGWHGSSERIKILPRDFHADDDTGRSPFIEEDTGGNISLRGHGASGLYASIPIPQQYTASSVMVYGSDTSNVVSCSEGFINTPTYASGGAGVIGTEFSFAPISSSNTNFLWITVEVAANDDLIYGGYVTITKP